MTDLERFIELYKSFGIICKIQTEEEMGHKTITLSAGLPHREDQYTRHKKLDGYSDFFSDIEFTKDGKFLRQGFWE